jgi:hypothetical protein
MRNQRRGHQTERPTPAPTGSPLRDLTWHLRDEHGTDYHQTGAATESEHYLDRWRTQWSPAPPARAEHLTLLATGTTGTIVLTAEIPIPRPAI